MASPLLTSQITETASVMPRVFRKTKRKLKFCLRCSQEYSPVVFHYSEKEYKAKQQTKDEELIEIHERIDVIRTKLKSVDDGELSISAYDTAWVALIKDIHGSGAPQFPSSIEWIVSNQLPDGSWGDRDFFSAYDRLSNTLACVVALTSWNIHPENCERGMSYVRENLYKLEHEDPEHMLSGFEVRLPTLIEMARNLQLEFQESHVLQDLYATRDRKLKRIPKEMLHSKPTTLLHSLEGMSSIDWNKILKLQHQNGSFLCSPSSTAYALMHTKDEKCFKYLQQIVKKFKGGVPNSYPMDIFEHLWIVDRLERLGISRHFSPEINEFLNHVYRYWSPKGLSWARNTIELDIDDTSMGFRILRLHGYEVTSDAFKHFEKDGQFFCFVGQSSQGVTEMLSLYRASQILFPGETILEEARTFTYKFLREKQDLGKVADRWLITKDLAGEVRYALEVPFMANLPRIETRSYIDQYGGDNDVWIAKVLYRMYNVSSNLYLELAKMDYNHCQKLHKLEWDDIQRWYKKYDVKEFGVGQDRLLQAYFVAMSCIFEPERETERFAWAQTKVLIEAITLYTRDTTISAEQKGAFFQAFIDNTGNFKDNRLAKSSGGRLLKVIMNTISDISLDVRKKHRKDVKRNLKHVWNTWAKCNPWEGNHYKSRDDAELLVYTINLCSNRSFSMDIMSRPVFIHLIKLANKICNRLLNEPHLMGERIGDSKDKMDITLSTEPIEEGIKELMQHVVKREAKVDHDVKQTFMLLAKSFYYVAYFRPSTINRHIAKVLFERVI